MRPHQHLHSLCLFCDPESPALVGLRLNRMRVAALPSKDWAHDSSPAQPMGSYHVQRQEALQNVTSLLGSKWVPQTADTWRFPGQVQKPFILKACSDLGITHDFLCIIWQVFPLAQWENVVEMQLENRLRPTWQMNHNWAWNFSKPLILTSSLINENQRKHVAGMTQRPSARMCWWNLQGAVRRRVQLLSILKSETKAWSQLLY